MNQDQPELTLEESIKQVMQTLPPIIRDYLTQGKYTAVAKDMMAKYGLRIDQGGVLEREIMLLLMGIENPDEFSKALAEDAKLDQKTINGIVEDINEQIFVPLREEMRKGPEIKQEPAKPVMTAPQPQPQSAAAQPPRPNWGSNKPLAEVKPPQVESGRPGLRNLLASITAEVPKSIESRKLLEDHEEPHIEFNKPPTIPSIVVPLPPKPAPQRIAPPKPVVSDKAQGASSPIPLKSSTLPLTPSPAKPYSTDPYREPVDEK